MTAVLTRRSLAKIKDTVIYLPHQLDGVRDGARRGSFILGDEMGLGKSLEALTIAAIDFEKGWAKRLLIVCPATLKYNWAGDPDESEIDKFTHFTYRILEGTPAQRNNQLDEYAASGTDVLVVGNEQLVSHLDRLNDLEFDIAVFDEAHNFKSRLTTKKKPQSKRCQAFMNLRVGRAIEVTGSSLLGQVEGLWSLLYRIDPVRFSNFWSFIHRFCVFGGYHDKQIVGIKHQGELREILQSYQIRRLKKDVLDLPKKTRIDVWVDKHPEQDRLIKQASEELKIGSPDGLSDIEISNSMVKYGYIKRILSTTANIPGQEDNSYKLDRAVEMIVEVIGNGRPVVVFTQFRGTLDAMTKRLDAACVDWRQLHGDVPIPERKPVVKAWSEDAAAGRPQALLCMIQVAGVGLTMTAASEAIFLDELFVPKLNEQGEDRLDRIGQTLPVTIYRIRVRKSFEQRVARILETKSDIFNAVVEVDDDWKRKLVQALSEEED